MNCSSHAFRHWLGAGAVALVVSACNGNLIAPEGPQSNAFLTRIANNCGQLHIGAQPLDYLINQSNDNVQFLDEASRLSAGLIDRATFASDINAFYLDGNNEPALACIFAQL